jgi:hypothetical protein
MAEQDSVTDCLSETWCNLAWSPWVAFATASRRMDVLPDEPGLYRIRPAGSSVLAYIGETGQSLRQTYAEIRQNTVKLQMPWSDPQPAAPALWAWKDAKGYAFEFSGSPSKDAADERRSVKSYLLYRYRQRYRESPSCNFGRFHRNYRRPSGQKEGISGGKLGPRDPLNPAGGPSASPLPASGAPGDGTWMGLAWSHRRALKTHNTAGVPPSQGVYLIFDAGSGDILAIGRSANCSQALFEISKNPWGGKDLAYSFYCEKKPMTEHNLRETENDLIGNYIETYQRVPEYQFRDTR